MREREREIERMRERDRERYRENERECVWGGGWVGRGVTDGSWAVVAY